MTPNQLLLVERSVPLISSAPEKFARRFYSRLFKLAPETRALFPEDMAELRTKLVDELVFLSNAASDLDTFVERSRDLGARHHEYGVTKDHYEIVERVLLGALAEAAGTAWSDDLHNAWQALYRHIATAMLG